MKKAPILAATSSDDKKDAVASNETNVVYFYGDVSDESTRKLAEALEKTDKAMRKGLYSFISGDEHYPIHLRIHSYGGHVFAGFAAFDLIRTFPRPIHTFVDGCVASAATFLSLAGHHRVIGAHGAMLIHQLSGWTVGNFRELEDDGVNNRLLMDKIKNIYRETTKVPPKELDNILGHDLWWNAEKCLEYGLVDEIV